MKKWLLILMFMFAGCAGAKVKPQSIIWPPPPNTARIKFIRALHGQYDFPRSTWKRFLNFLLGPEHKPALNQPMGIAISKDAERIYITDYQLGAVFVFNLKEKKVRYIGTDERYHLVHPFGVALDQNENVYVTDSILKRVRVFNKNGKFLRDIGVNMFERPTGIAIDQKRRLLYVADTSFVNSRKHRIRVFTLSGRHVRDIGTRGTKNGDFNFPTYLAVNKDGDLYVSDTLNFRVQWFSPKGKFLGKFGVEGDSPGTFDRIKGIAFDSYGNIYIADSDFHAVQMFTKNWKPLMYFGGPGIGPGQLIIPTAIAIDKNNRIYVADSYSYRVNVYQLINAGKK